MVELVRNGHLDRYSRSDDNLVDSHSNLNSRTLSDICLVCAMPENEFSDKASFIDVLLLKRRNSIAHGENTLIAYEDLELITSGTVELMRTFGDSLENLVALGKYRKVN